MARKGETTPLHVRAKMSAARKGWSPSAETRAKMSASASLRESRHTFTADECAASVAARVGRPLSPEHREKMRQAKLRNPVRHWLGKSRGQASVETRAKQSASMKGKPAAYPLKRFHYRGVPFRSTYERRVAQAFDLLGMRWEFEPRRFDCGAETYLPDFFLPDEDMYVEVKGYYGPNSATTMSLMFSAHPDVSVAILQLPQIEALESFAALRPLVS
jgi:hypothetical protein